jgi:hypothetical protein
VRRTSRTRSFEFVTTSHGGGSFTHLPVSCLINNMKKPRWIKSILAGKDIRAAAKQPERRES